MDLISLRTRIDRIDNRILKLLEKRFKIAKKLRVFKRRKKLPIEDKDREKQLLEALSAKSRRYGIDPKFTNDLFRLIIKESKRVQKKQKP